MRPDDNSPLRTNRIGSIRELPDIPAGTFRLHLRSTNGDGVWVDNEQTLTIHRRAAFSEQQEHIENNDDHRFSEHIRTYISDHLADSDLSVQDIANEMAVSRTVLFARMKSIFGTSPNNYLLNRRIERAKELLRQPNAYITDIAYRSGFSDPKYFSKCFKKLTGQTPSEFQKL